MLKRANTLSVNYDGHGLAIERSIHYCLGRSTIMSTLFCQSLQERISRLKEELAQLETQQTAAIGNRSQNHTPEQRQENLREVVATMEAFRKVERRLHQAKQLLARAQGDEYAFEQHRRR